MIVPTGPVATSNEDRLVYWAFLALAATFAVGLFNHGLVPSMEPRFAEVLREMLDAGEWLIPTKNGWAYVEYPAFYYWLAIAGKLIGLPMTAAIRLPSYLAFLGWLYLLRQWQTYAAPNLAPYAYALAGAAMPLALFKFSIAQTDSLLAFGVMLSMYGYAKHRAGGSDQGFPWLIWVGTILATLAKGPVGIVCTLPIVFLDAALAGLQVARSGGQHARGTTVKRVASSVFSVGWLRGIALLLAVTAPWYLLAGLSRGWDFVQAVLVYQNYDRYVTGYSHAQPWWYYFKTVSYDFFPASVVLPVGLWAAVRSIERPHARLVLIWAVFTFLFFSISGSKQGKYLLPAAPAFVALSFLAIDAIRRRKNIDLWRWARRWYLTFIAIWCVLVCGVVPFFSDQIGGKDGFEPIKAQLAAEPGQLIHYQWPRSLTLYELGGPMPFVRSARELYDRIQAGEFRAGDYILVKKSELGPGRDAADTDQLVPYPNDAWFEQILETEVEKTAVLLRIREGAEMQVIPDTPEPPILHWRDAMFDTD
jgi:4-amino-4-deoxy-L-arabinose transferase-like glycosyltransferase